MVVAAFGTHSDPVAHTPVTDIMKGGQSLKRSGAVTTPQKPVTALPVGSPAVLQPPKKNRGGKAGGGTAQPGTGKGSGTATPPGLSLGDMPIHTPPPRTGQADASDPEVDCTAAEVMAYVLRGERAHKDLVEDLEQRTAHSFNVFRQEHHEAMVDKGTFEARFGKLTKQLDDFAEKLQGYTVKTEKLEANFKEHVDVAFGIVDSEYRKLKEFIKDVEHDAKIGKSSGVASASAARDSLLQSRLRILEENLGNVKGDARAELTTQKASIGALDNALIAAGVEIEAVKEDILRVDTAAKLSTGKFPCHCSHVDVLDARVVTLETAWNGRVPAGSAAAPPPMPHAEPRPARQPLISPAYSAAFPHCQTFNASDKRDAHGCGGGPCGHGGGAPGAPGGGHGGGFDGFGPGPAFGPGGHGHAKEVNFGRLFDDKIASSPL